MARLRLSKTLTSYVARHTWATVLRKAGTSVAVISSGMHHSSEKVTQIYLDSIENSELDKANEALL